MNEQEVRPLERAYLEAALDGDRETAQRLEVLVDLGDAAQREERLRQPAAFLAAALWYAEKGLPVFPCRPGVKQPATLHGFKDATRSTATIREWWTEWPLANVGLPTGIRFDVVDVDGPEGLASLSKLTAGGDLPPVIGQARTPRGQHFYIEPTGDGNTQSLLPGIDYRGNGGYVLAPPSQLVACPDVKVAGYYRWIVPVRLG